MQSMSKIAIVNMSLHLIGGGIALISLEETKKEANLINRLWDGARQSVLSEEKANWSFAIKHRLLDVSADTNMTNFDYNYMLPSDCIRPMTIDDYEGYPFTVESGHLYCDVAQATLKYIYDNTDVTKYSPGFARVLAHRLAVDMAAALEKDTSFIFQKYQIELNRAIGQDARASKNKTIVARPYKNVRFDYRGRNY